MAQQRGRLVQWNDDRGFGFIEGGNGQRHFVHISAFERTAARPMADDPVSFTSVQDSDGRAQAKSVRILKVNAAPAGRPRLRSEPGGNEALDWRLPLALVCVVLLVFGFVLGRVPVLLILAYAGMGVVSFIAYGLDKSFARTGRRRTSETTLLALDLFLGVIGGLVAQAVFRHKTRKTSFIASVIVIACVHLLWLAALAFGLIHADDLMREAAALLGSGG